MLFCLHIQAFLENNSRFIAVLIDEVVTARMAAEGHGILASLFVLRVTHLNALVGSRYSLLWVLGILP